MVITICGSLKFFDKIQEIATKLDAQGYKTFLPKKVEGIDYWAQDGLARIEAKKRFNLIGRHMSNIEQSDAILIVNITKDETENYIGANTFAEVMFACYKEKKIFLLNPIPDQKYIAEEIRATEPIVLNGDLAQLSNIDKKCDQTSIGVLVWKNEELLLIERAKPPFGFAPPAGHLDQDTDYKVAAKRELKEETGLDCRRLRLVKKGKKDNRCRRDGGDWHYWRIYEVEALGELKINPTEVKQAGWYSREEISKLAKKTEAKTSGRISEQSWQRSPGLEPVWYEWFKELMIV